MQALFRGAVMALLCLLTVFSVAAPVAAQTPAPAAPAGEPGGPAAQVTLSEPDISQFPQVSFYLDAGGPEGFLDGLGAADVRVLENAREIAPAAVTRLEPGVQIIVAYNPDPLMAGKGAGGASLFQQVHTALVDWAKKQPAGGQDDFTLIGSQGVQTIRQDEPARWASELENYQPDLLHSKPGLASLSQALDMATDPNPRPMMKRALLYITPLPAESQLAALEGQGATAARLGLRVYIWALLPANKPPDPKGLNALQSLAGASGGSLTTFTGAEALPDPDDLLDPLRHCYQVTYLSQAQQPGAQSLRVAVSHAGERLVSGAQQFRLDVQPPNPIFVGPPAEIRQVVGGSQPTLAPVNLRIVIEFPDGHARAIQRSALYVDGQLAAERTSPPFDQFTWLPPSAVQSTAHRLQVKVTDQLGLAKASAEIPVQVTVEKRGAALLQERIQLNPRRLVIGGAVTLAAAALASVLWFGGRQGWLLPDRRRKKLLKDPVTQPVKIVQDLPRLPGKSPAAERQAWPLGGVGRKPAAWLVRLDEENLPIPGQAIPLQRREVTIGSDPRQATIPLDLPAVDSLHARIQQAADGAYTLRDAGSVAGTYRNFTPVGPDGQRLAHGDLVHIGRAAFRFELAHPARVPQPVARKYDGPL